MSLTKRENMPVQTVLKMPILLGADTERIVYSSLVSFQQFTVSLLGP